MTDEDIRKLARECTEDFRKDVLQFFPTPLPDSMEVLVQEEQKSIVKVLQWLSERFCIVEKSVMDKLSIVYRAKAYNLVCLNKEDVEALFGKELFNDTEK